MWIDWLDLPKLTSLTTSGSGSSTFRYPRYITLESDSHSLWMMFRHAQTHRCVSSRGIQVQERRYNHRKYSFHPSLTNRHRSSSQQVQLITERHVTPFFVPHTHNNHFPTTSELIQRHWRERYRCANTEIMTIRIWNDGNPIRIVETTSNDHSLHIAWNPCHFAFQITYIASPFKRQSNPNHSVILKRTANHLQNSLFHHSLPVNHIQIPIPSQLPHNPNTLKSSSLHILLVPTIPFQSRIPPFPTPLPTSLFPIP